MSRRTNLEECGAGFGQKTPTGQESVGWVGRSVVLWKQLARCVSLPVVWALFVSAVRRGVGADGVEQHAAVGGQRPEQALREEGTDRTQDERAAPSQLRCRFSFALFLKIFWCCWAKLLWQQWEKNLYVVKRDVERRPWQAFLYFHKWPWTGSHLTDRFYSEQSLKMSQTIWRALCNTFLCSSQNPWDLFSSI